MRYLSTALVALMLGQIPSAQAADAIRLLKQFDTLREQYPDLIARNLQIVIDTTRSRTPEEEARAVDDDNHQEVAQLADAFGPVLGPIFAEGLGSGALPLTTVAIGLAYVTVISAPLAKEYFQNPRPFSASDQVIRAPGSSGGGYSFPSGHTTFGYTMSLVLAYMFPERYQEILTRASEFGNNRIVVGVHYPMDVIGGRIISQASVAELLANPLTRTAFNLAAQEMDAYFARKCGASAAECAAARTGEDLFGNYEQNKADYNHRLTYGFTGTFDTARPMTVPTGAEFLIATRFPYLNTAQLREVLRTTALPSGDAMEDIDGWERLNLFAAADGFGAIDADTRVVMLGRNGGVELYDRWRNDIGGDATLTKAGTGWLDLTGDNSFAGVVVEGGTLRLLGGNDFSGQSAVREGTLIVDGSLKAMAVDVAGGNAVLSGSGRVQAPVSVAGGGTISPGTDGAGTLTIGSLSLAPDAKLAFDFNQPGVIGGGANDLIAVDGDLTLDGTLNITSTAGLAPGVYRVFNYGGSLTDHGLDFGAFPGNVTAAALLLDTSNASQVNLVVDGVEGELAYWNGATTAADDAVHGGSGTWSATLTNWTNVDGSAVAAWAGKRAVFQATGGTVTIEGLQAIAGLVFVTDGYRLVAGSDGALRTNGTVDIQVNPGITALIAAPITGPGGIDKTDGGILTLSGLNSYAGGTTLSGGTLSVSSDANLGDAAGRLTFDGGVLRVTGTGFASTGRDIVWGAGGGGFDIADAGHSFTVDQDLGGPGGMLKTGAGTLVLTGGNSYGGGLLVSAGTVIGNAASLVGNIVNDGRVVFDQATDGLFAGNIGGTGSVGKTGDGILTVTGNFAPTGGTTISAGTLQIGDGGTSGAIYNSIANDATLVFNRADDWTFSGTISGDGTVIKRGAGILSLTGTSSLTGDTLVEAGILNLNGNIEGSSVTLRGGTTLAGIGRLGGLTAQSGAVVSPGDAAGVGVLAISGDLDLAGGSTYEVDIDADGDNDKITATGKASIGEGARLSVYGLTAPGTTYTIITAGDGVFGRFDELTDAYAFLDATVDYGTDTVSIGLERNGTAFADAANTANGRAAAKAAEGLGAGNALYDALITADMAGAATAFDTLSGEIYADAIGVLRTEAQHVQDIVIDRLRRSLAETGEAVAAIIPANGAASGTTGEDGEVGHGAFWTSAYGAWGSHDGGDAGAGVDTSTAGIMAGADGLIGDDWRIGLAGGYSRISADSDGTLSSAEIDSYGLALYAGRQRGPIGIRLGASYAWQSIDNDRTVVLPGAAQQLEGSYNAQTAQVFGDVGYTIPIRGRVAAEPFVGLAFTNISTDDAVETGGSAALVANGQNRNDVTSTVGLRIGGTKDTENSSFSAGGAIAWRHAYGDAEPATTVNFGDDDTSAFTTSGAPIARDALALEAGVDFRLTRRLHLGVRYSGQIASEADEHGLQANVKIRF